MHMAQGRAMSICWRWLDAHHHELQINVKCTGTQTHIVDHNAAQTDIRGMHISEEQGAQMTAISRSRARVVA